MSQSRDIYFLTTTGMVAGPMLFGHILALAFAPYALWFTALSAVVAVGLLMYNMRNGGAGGFDTRLLATTLQQRDPSAFDSLLSQGLALEAQQEIKGLLADLNAKETALSAKEAALSDKEQTEAELREEAEAATNAVATYQRTLEKMGIELTTLAEALTQQVGSLSKVKGAADNTTQSLARTMARLDDLSHSAESSSSSIIQMVAMNNEVRENVHNLASSVDETTTAIEEMTFSSKEVAKNIEELSTAAEETAASMNEMDVSINQVETNATETSRLSEQVTRDAETGVAAINHTIRGIDNIKESSRVAAETITNLGQKINQIGNILNVIDDVAEQTNLLALNAAIIAAQAGEHGRGFAVVADEIKALAERTGSSTKEIAGLIRSIQDESRNAVNVMAKGVEDVEEGVRLGHNAEDALRKIVESAKRSTLMIHAIAQATVEQAKGSKQVTNAISRIAETVQQIAFATAEQAKGAEHIMQSAERMKVITQQVERSADEQNRGGQQVTQAIENIREMADRIGQDSRSQENTAHELSEAMKSLDVATTRLQDVSDALQRILGDASALLESTVLPSRG